DVVLSVGQIVDVGAPLRRDRAAVDADLRLAHRAQEPEHPAGLRLDHQPTHAGAGLRGQRDGLRRLLLTLRSLLTRHLRPLRWTVRWLATRRPLLWCLRLLGLLRRLLTPRVSTGRTVLARSTGWRASGPWRGLLPPPGWPVLAAGWMHRSSSS